MTRLIPNTIPAEDSETPQYSWRVGLLVSNRLVVGL